tara:strand:- start:55 stop:195 length:141 start_codon:yes stop_codon:yes gene_type:complete
MIDNKNEIVVYTALFGDYSDLMPQPKLKEMTLFAIPTKISNQVLGT